jgi:hypothetical protein
MDERWNRIETLFHAALDQPEEERRLFVREQCGIDVDLAREIESLLDFEARGSSPARRPAERIAADFFQPQVQLDLEHYRIVSKLGAGG